MATFHPRDASKVESSAAARTLRDPSDREERFLAGGDWKAARTSHKAVLEMPRWAKRRD